MPCEIFFSFSIKKKLLTFLFVNYFSVCENKTCFALKHVLKGIIMKSKVTFKKFSLKKNTQ